MRLIFHNDDVIILELRELNFEHSQKLTEMQCATSEDKLEFGPEWLVPGANGNGPEDECYEEIDVVADDDDEAKLREYYKPNMNQQQQQQQQRQASPEYAGNSKMNMAQKLNAVRAHQLQQIRMPVSHMTPLIDVT